MTTETATTGWPVPGRCLIPQALRRAWKYELVPAAVLRQSNLPEHLTIARLEEAPFREAAAANRALTNYIVFLVTQRLYNREEELAPQPFLGVTARSARKLKQLPLSRRTRNALLRGGRLEDEQWLSTATATDLLALPGLGAKSLLELGCAVDDLLSELAMVDDSLIEEDIEVRGNRDAKVSEDRGAAVYEEERSALRRRILSFFSCSPRDRIRVTDPRFAHLPIPMNETTVALALENRVNDAAGDELRELELLVEATEEVINQITADSLDRQLMELLSLTVPAAHREALARRLGWDGRGGTTLEGAAEISHVTRERIRQIQGRTAKRLVASGSFLPALDRAIHELEDAANSFEPDADILLATRGVTSKPFLPAGVLTAAELFGRSVEFRLGDDARSVVPLNEAPGLPQAFRSLSDVNWVASLDELVERARGGDASDGKVTAAEARSWMDRHDSTVWLDESKTWFWARQKEGRNRYLNLAKRILSVTDPIPVSSLRDGLLRSMGYRGQSASLPRRIIPALFAAMGLRVDGEFVSSPTALRPAEILGQAEKIFYEILVERTVLTGFELRRACVAAGMNRNTFSVYLTYSPIVERLASGIYTLRGRSPDPGAIAAARDRLSAPRSRALQDSGWTGDRGLWMGYIVTESVEASNIVQVPTGFIDVIGGRKFELITVDGAEVGTLAVNEKGQAWGIGPFARRRGLEVGDALVIAVDTDLDCALIQSGTPELLDEYINGRGLGPSNALESLTRPAEVDL